jgi:hypothetical protein
VVLGPKAASVRRELGPTAWVVLEAIVATSTAERDGVARAVTSARALGHELGLAKDTVAAALRRLHAAGFVTRDPQRRGGTGGFVAGSYVVHAQVARDVVACRTDASTIGARRTRSTPGPATSRQATLFESTAP